MVHVESYQLQQLRQLDREPWQQLREPWTANLGSWTASLCSWTASHGPQFMPAGPRILEREQQRESWSKDPYTIKFIQLIDEKNFSQVPRIEGKFA